MSPQPKDKLKTCPHDKLKTYPTLLLLGLSVAAVTFLNPHGPFIYGHILRLSGHPNIATMYEWQPLDFTRPAGAHWSYLVLLGLVVGSQLLCWRWPSPVQVLLLVAFALPPLLQERMMIWWVMVVPWLVLPAWKGIGQRLTWKWLHYQSKPNFYKTLIAAALVIVALPWWGPVQWLATGQPRPLPATLSRATPWQLAWQLEHPGEDALWGLPPLRQALALHYPDGQFQGCIWASETLGDYLLWQLPPDMPVLAFSHAHVFTVDYWQDHMTILHGKEGWDNILRERRANLVVVEPQLWGELARQLRQSEEWLILVDETGLPQKPDVRTRLLIALRKELP